MLAEAIYVHGPGRLATSGMCDKKRGRLLVPGRGAVSALGGLWYHTPGLDSGSEAWLHLHPQQEQWRHEPDTTYKELDTESDNPSFSLS